MVNYPETESQIKVRVPTELKNNWEGVELAVSSKLTHVRELVPFERDPSKATAASQRLLAVRKPWLKELMNLKRRIIFLQRMKYYQFKVSLTTTLI